MWAIMKNSYKSSGLKTVQGGSPDKIRKSITGLLARITAACVFAAIPFSPGASAQTVNFNGNIPAPNACIIIVLSDGTLAPNPTGTQLSSKNPGGVGGIARVISFTNYRIWLDAPAFFLSSPPGFDGSGVAFSTLFSGTSIFRGRNFTDRPGTNPRRLRRGFSITEITADLIADNTGPYSTGNYTSYATLRCE